MKGLVLVSLLAALLLIFGCTNIQDIKAQDGIVLSCMGYAQGLLAFQEQSQLASFEPNYLSYSNEAGAACVQLNKMDSGKSYWSNTSVAFCENKKGLDNCFFQLEKIRGQVKNGEADINLDSLDVLCTDLRSMGLQANLDGFKAKYKAYAAWLGAEKDITAKWGELVASYSNASTVSETNNAKLSDYYKDYKDSSAKAQVLLQGIKSDCALKDDFNATNSTVEKACSNIDGYISDLDKANAVVLDMSNFFGQFETGTVTIDRAFISDCRLMSDEFSGLYGLKLINDTAPSMNKTELASMCESLENLSNVYRNLGVPLVFENGQLSSATKNELFKAKTVYVNTGTVLGSGVIIMSDPSDSSYYILTNAHVALDYDSSTGNKYAPDYVRVKFYDGRVGYADKLAYDQEGYDFVVLHVKSSGYYPVASFDPSYVPSVGDKVVAVGNPEGLEFSVTQGTVSGIRNVGCFTDYCYGYVIQTDTAVNPGNSGGGLWDYDSGDLLGINSFGLTQTEGLNFAISMYEYDMIKDTFKWYSLQ